jgi:hypothetical protein
MGRPRKLQPAAERLRPAERARRMRGAETWAVVIVRHDGRRRIFAEYPPTSEGKNRAARQIVQLRKVGCLAELHARSALPWDCE